MAKGNSGDWGPSGGNMEDMVEQAKAAKVSFAEFVRREYDAPEHDNVTDCAEHVATWSEGRVIVHDHAALGANATGYLAARS